MSVDDSVPSSGSLRTTLDNFKDHLHDINMAQLVHVLQHGGMTEEER